MTAVTESTRRKPLLPQLAEELGNASKACRITGYDRDSLLRGPAGLPGRRCGRPTNHLNDDRGTSYSGRKRTFLGGKTNGARPSARTRGGGSSILSDTWVKYFVRQQHRRTKVRSPRTSGFVERMNRTLPDECCPTTGRTNGYTSPAEIRQHLDQHLSFYNLRRGHQRYRLKVRTPAQARREALGRKTLRLIVPKEGTTAAKQAA